MPEELSKVNPRWRRPKNWPYEEDWNSPAWQARMNKRMDVIKMMRQMYGFVDCPECGNQHTGKTCTCRNCGHKADCF